MNNYEQSFQTLQALAQTISEADENEATTRFAYIDPILTDCLRWPVEQVKCEEHHEGDYLDYVLGSPSPRAVVEAKRTSRIFEVPAGTATGKIKLKTLRDFGRNAEALEQVMGYCQKSGTAIAVLSNGDQFLAFLGSRSDGKPPIEGDAFLFTSLGDACAHFTDFWNFLSYEGIHRGDLTAVLNRNSELPLAPSRLSQRISGYPGYRIGSEMETDLRILGDLFIQDITRVEEITDDFLAECYCVSGALSQYATVSKEILRTRYQVLAEQVATEHVTTRKGVSETLKKDVVAAALVRRPIVLVGDVGVGKSMFLRHLFRVEASDLVGEATVIYVDFLNHSGLVDDVPEYLVGEIENALAVTLDVDIRERQFVRAVYNAEINKFARGVYGFLQEDDPVEFRRREAEMLAELLENPLEHAKRALSHLQATRRTTFVIALDNVDQHQPMFQEQIFVAGQSVAETWPVTVFLSLRPDTFHLSRRSGALAAYQPRVFTVSPPRADHVILKRLEFADKQLQEFGRLPGFPAGLTINSESLSVYISVLKAAFNSNEKLITLVDNLSSGNIRKALDFISTFVGSGYVQTNRILEAHEKGGQYRIPFHEFIRAILYGDQKHYDPRSSPVPNIFHSQYHHPKEHFLSGILLALVEKFGGTEVGGFVPLTDIYERLHSLGFIGLQIGHHIDRLAAAGCIETTGDTNSATQLRITASGSYLHKQLLVDFAYVDAMIVDTPIMDSSVRSEIQDVFDIEDRLERVKIFEQYLFDCWDFPSEEAEFDWTQMRSILLRNIAEVERGAARAAERRRRDA